MTDTTEPLKCPKCQTSFRSQKTIGVSDLLATRCPRCQHQSELGDFRRAALFSSIAGGNKSIAGNVDDSAPPGPPPVQRAAEPASDSGSLHGAHWIEQGALHTRQLLRRRGTASDGIIDFFDFGFKRYLTPMIIKITWGVSVLVTVSAILLLFLVSVGLISVDIFSELGVGLPDFGEQVSRPPVRQAPSDSPELDNAVTRSSAKAISHTIAFCFQTLFCIVALLWIRVALEGAIVVFQMAADVAAIRAKAERS